MNKISIIKRFYVYQKMRFPMIIISLSLLPAILSSGAVVGSNISLIQTFIALLISILYLLHIRILDDRRDFDHDSLYHKSRPVQKGIITNKELRNVDLIILPSLIVLGASFGILGFLLIVTMLFYSFLAEKNFFVEKTLKKHFLTYNFVNTIQTFLLQLVIYIVFSGFIPLTGLVIFHFLFTCLGTIIFEFVRKVKMPKEIGVGKDTYTWYFGFKKAMIVYVLLAFINLFLFFLVVGLTSSNLIWLLFSIVALLIIVGTSYMHISKRDYRTEQLVHISFGAIYAFCNLAIYFSKLY